MGKNCSSNSFSSIMAAPTKAQWAWLVLAASTAASFLGEGILCITSVYLVTWKEYFQCSMAEVSLIASTSYLSFHVGGMSGMLVNRVGSRPVVVLGGLAMAVGMIASVYADSIPLLCFTYGLAAFFAGGAFVGYTFAIACYFNKHFSTVRGVTAAGTGLAIMTLPPLAQYLIDMYGWQGSLLIFASIMANVMVFGMLMRPESAWIKVPPSRKHSRFIRRTDTGSGTVGALEDGERSRVDSASNANVYRNIPNDEFELQIETNLQKVVGNGREYHEADKCMANLDQGGSATNCEDISQETVGVELPSDHSDVVKVISLKMSSASSSGCCRTVFSVLGIHLVTCCFRMWLVLASQFIYGLAYGAALNHLPISMVYRGLDPQAASFLMTFMGIGSLIGRIVNGVIVDFGLISAARLYMICTIMCGMSMIVCRLGNVYWVYASACVVIGLGSGAVFSLMVVLFRMYVGKAHLGRAMTLCLLMIGVGGFIGPILGGWMYDVTGSYDIASYFFGIVLTLSGVIFLLEPMLQRKELAKARRLLEQSGRSVNDQHDPIKQ